MTYFIFNHSISKEQIGVEAISIASDQEIVYQGTKEGLSQYELDESHIGGIYKGTKDFYETEIIGTDSEGIETIGTNVITKPWLYFNQELKDFNINLNKPILSGEVLGKKLRSLFKNRTIAERKFLLSPILTDINILEKDDEVTQAEYDELKQDLMIGIDDKLSDVEKSQIEQILDDFVSSFRL